MKERPILFSADMVRAILDGRKTQTRRVVKWPVSAHSKILGKPMEHEPMVMYRGVWYKPTEWSPYGVTGDHLWVKETWQTAFLEMHEDEKPSEINPCSKIVYYADGFECSRWRPSIFMPRWASRITLEKTSNREPERVQSISEADAIAEGIQQHDGLWDNYLYGKDWIFEGVNRRGYFGFKNPVISFASLWDLINAKRGHSWEKNDWVWPIEFKVVEE